MPFLQLTLDIDRADPAPFEATLFAVGALSVTLQDAADDPILEPAPGALPLWPTVTIKALFAANADTDEILAALRRQITVLPTHCFESIADRAWEREWLKDFKPMQFGQRLWVCPGGMLPPVQQTTTIIVQLDPGLAFGTGTHPTTALCLEWLDAANLHDKSVLDYGCGSGILAIAALKLGARFAVGVDIDGQALTASRDNAQRNGISDRLTLQSTNVAAPAPSDVVLANILAGPLAELAPTIAKQVLPGGNLVLSGILLEQAADLAQRYATWFDMDAPVCRENWSRLTGIRKAVDSRL